MFDSLGKNLAKKFAKDFLGDDEKSKTFRKKLRMR